MNIPEFADRADRRYPAQYPKLHEEGTSLKDYLVPMAWEIPALARATSRRSRRG